MGRQIFLEKNYFYRHVVQICYVDMFILLADVLGRLTMILWELLYYGLYIPWKVTGMSHSTSALATSDRSLALRMSMYAGLWEPGAATMVSITPVGTAQNDHSTSSLTDARAKLNIVFWLLLLYHHPHRHRQGSEQTEAQRGMSQAPAIPRSPWSSRSTCRSRYKRPDQLMTNVSRSLIKIWFKVLYWLTLSGMKWLRPKA